MTLLLHPTLAAKPGLATAIATRLGGEWEVRGGYCRFRALHTATVLPFQRVGDLIPACLRQGAPALPFDPNGPRAA